VISSREYAWYNKIRAGNWWNRTSSKAGCKQL